MRELKSTTFLVGEQQTVLHVTDLPSDKQQLTIVSMGEVWTHTWSARKGGLLDFIAGHSEWYFLQRMVSERDASSLSRSSEVAKLKSAHKAIVAYVSATRMVTN